MNNWEYSVRYCQNCGKKLYGVRDKNGILKLSCPDCNTFYLCKKHSRRKETVEITAPSELEII